MSKVVTNYQTGLKYSFREHGMRSRIIAAFAAFVVAFGGALVLASPANAVVPSGGIAVTVCGDGATWYVNSDEGGADPKQGDRRPAATNAGLVFTNNDLIHHEVQPPLALSALKPGSFSYSALPDQSSFFSVEVGNPGYATLRWDTTLNEWNIGGTSTYSADPTTFVGQKGLTAASTVLSFGVGYTNTPPGTVAVTVSSITFQGVLYNLVCPVPAATVTVQVPGPTVVVTKDQTVYVQAPAPTPTVTPSPSVTPSVTTRQPPTATTTVGVLPVASPASGSGSSGMNWTLWALIAAAALAALLVLIGLVKANQRRRAAEANQYVGAHAADNDRTQVIPAIRDNVYHDGGYDPKLGGWAGENYPLGHDGYGPEPDDSATVQAPKVSEGPTPGDSDTRPLPPVQG